MVLQGPGFKQLLNNPVREWSLLFPYSVGGRGGPSVENGYREDRHY